MKKNHIIAGWPDTKDMLHADLKAYWSYRDELAVIDGVILKGRHIIIPTNLRHQILEQLHTNHMGIEKTTLPAHESVYWPSINADIDSFIKNILHVFTSSRHSQRRRSSTMIYHFVHGRLPAWSYSILLIKITYVL